MTTAASFLFLYYHLAAGLARQSSSGLASFRASPRPPALPPLPPSSLSDPVPPGRQPALSARWEVSPLAPSPDRPPAVLGCRGVPATVFFAPFFSFAIAQSAESKNFWLCPFASSPSFGCRPPYLAFSSSSCSLTISAAVF